MAVALGILLAGCTPEAQQTTPESVPETQTALADTPPAEPEVKITLPREPNIITVLEPAAEEQPEVTDELWVLEYDPPWDILTARRTGESWQRNSALIAAASSLLASQRVDEANALTALIDTTNLEPGDRINLEFLRIRRHQAAGNHRQALARLRALQISGNLDTSQRLRALRLKIYSISHTDDPIELASAMADLISMLPAGPQSTRYSHELWSLLHRIPAPDLMAAIAESSQPIHQQWMQLAAEANAVQHDPYRFSQALANWLNTSPDHPARQLIEAGLGHDPAPVRRIAILLPLTSRSQTASQVFLKGVTAQHALNSSPDKPQIEIIDIGADPTLITQHYYRAVETGADYVIGPLGVEYVEELAAHGDLLLPTLMLGNAENIRLPEQVLQFSLAPESEGIKIARQARGDGYARALILSQPAPWSKRASQAFQDEWNALGGVVLEVHDFELQQSDYSEVVKNMLSISASVERYGEVRRLTGQRLSFTPRHRQDVDLVLLTADAEHGRLIKPHIDFLGAIELPVYATHHIFSGQFNKILDQDLDGIQFAEMSWVVDRSPNLQKLKESLLADDPLAVHFQRLFAMGVDAYNLAFRAQTLRSSSQARHHGVTGMLAVNEDGLIVREPLWMRFSEGEPVVNTITQDPEATPPAAGHRPPPILTQAQWKSFSTFVEIQFQNEVTHDVQ